MSRTTGSGACSTSARRRSCSRTPTPSRCATIRATRPTTCCKRLKDNGGVVMATFVPGFVSQALRDWLKRSRDAYGKAPLVADPKAQLAELETRHGPAPRATLARGRRPYRLSRRDRGRRPRRDRLGLLRRRAAERPRARRPLPASVRRTDPPRLLRARPRRRSPRATSCASCARSSGSAKRCAKRASRRSGGSRIIRGREGAKERGGAVFRRSAGLSGTYGAIFRRGRLRAWGSGRGGWATAFGD